MGTMREKLINLREEKGLTQADVASYLGISRQAYTMYEAGKRTPKTCAVLKMCELFGVPVNYLLDAEPTTEIATSAAIRVPVFGIIPAGVPLEAIEDILDWEEIPEVMAHGGKEYFSLVVQGDSMWPDYQPGDRVIVQKTPVCNTGDVCVVYINGYNATLKKVKLGEDGSVTLVPRNPEYPEKHYAREDVLNLPVSIAGVVVEIRRQIKKH